MDTIKIDRIRPEYAEPLAELQRICFPQLAEDERLKAEHFLQHCRIFPEGDFVALDGDRVVGLGAGFFIDFDLDRPQHRYVDIIAGGYFSNHDPNGAFYYDADISVHPDYRGRSIGSRIYALRRDLVRRYRRRGIVAGGTLPDYQYHKDQMTVQDYVKRVAAGELYDSTLSFQLKNGFEVLGVLEDYIRYPETGDRCSLIVWWNPDLIVP
jgi:GNAT superfamily N-acetyltransferase